MAAPTPSGFAGQGGSFGASTVNSFGGAVGDLFSAQSTASSLRIKAHGDLAEAQNYDLAAGLATQNEEFTRQSTAIKEMQTQRQIYQGIGTEEAGIAGSGFQRSGSALDLLRSSAQQGALTQQVVSSQGLITEAGYQEQAQAYGNMAQSATWAAGQEEGLADKGIKNSYITAGIKVLAGGASLA